MLWYQSPIPNQPTAYLPAYLPAYQLVVPRLDTAPHVDMRGRSRSMRRYVEWQLRWVHVAACVGAAGGDAWGPLLAALGMRLERGGLAPESGGGGGGGGLGPEAAPTAGACDVEGALLTVLEAHATQATTLAEGAAQELECVTAACNEWCRPGLGGAVATLQLHTPRDAHAAFDELTILLGLAGYLERASPPPLNAERARAEKDAWRRSRWGSGEVGGGHMLPKQRQPRPALVSSRLTSLGRAVLNRAEMLAPWLVAAVDRGAVGSGGGGADHLLSRLHEGLHGEPRRWLLETVQRAVDVERAGVQPLPDRDWEAACELRPKDLDPTGGLARAWAATDGVQSTVPATLRGAEVAAAWGASVEAAARGYAERPRGTSATSLCTRPSAMRRTWRGRFSPLLS